MLLCTIELLFYSCRSLYQILDVGDSHIPHYTIQNLCTTLLSTMAIVSSPLEVLYRYTQYILTIQVQYNLLLYDTLLEGFIGGGNQSTQRKPPIWCKSLTNFITKCCIEYTSPWAGYKLTTLVVIGTDCTGSCKSSCHMNMTAPALLETFSQGKKGVIKVITTFQCVHVCNKEIKF